MYCLLKSQLNGKPFLVLRANDERDMARIEEWLVDMKLSAELFLTSPDSIPTMWSDEEWKSHKK